MYVVLLNYVVSLEEIDLLLPDHVEWLEKHFAAGEFLMAGRRNPRVGGVIITRPMLRGKLDTILATDPFKINHVATYEVVEFAATRTAPELFMLNEAPSATG
ncbi:MAG TPA: YciI family protein [Amycolatopsis sp.]|uniref:YciI family protein n=1 Tax=Amycolatopsis sp. TaxID=37632 RepID=UPI002B49FD94|nr:YciI family protein [Amycolatopsis sp.]HKS44724.1 YciI family protein [Amycolatopsis sp.]